MIALAIIGVVIACCYVLVFALACAAGRADEALKRMWEDDEPLRRRPGGGWSAR